MLDIEVSELVKEVKTHNKITQRNSWVFPKKGIVRKANNYNIKKFQLNIGDTYSYQGKAYSQVYEYYGRRTVFLKNPVTINNEKYYLELKGYGANGKYIYPREHSEGDIFYGMYYEKAQKEYDLLDTVYNLGVDSPLAIALVEIKHEDFIKHMFLGLEKLISAYVKFGNVDSKLWEKFLRKNGYKGKISQYDWYEPKKSQINATLDILKFIYNEKGPNKLHQHLRYLTSKNPSAKSNPINFVRFDARAGYVIRACKSPLRVGDPNDKNIYNKKNILIARQIGQDFRLLLENGYLHSTPSVGNWTQAGELTDFEDVINLRTGQLELFEIMYFFSTNTLEEYVRFILGYPHCGELTEYFCEGVMGKKTSFRKTCDAVLSILREFV